MLKGITIQKGIDSYSAFFDNGKLAKTDLDQKLKKKGITDVYTCGIATDVCVSYTSNDAQDLGYRTILIENASGGIIPDNIATTKDSARAKNGMVVDSTSVKDLVQGLYDSKQQVCDEIHLWIKDMDFEEYLEKNNMDPDEKLVLKKIGKFIGSLLLKMKK